MIYYWANDCIKGSLELPNSVFGISCELNCPEDQYLGYENGETQCFQCPPETYNTGKVFRLKQQYKELTRLNFNKFHKNCYVLSDTTEIDNITKIRNINCNGWNTDNTNKCIQTSNNSNLLNVTIYSELVYGVHLYKDGYVLLFDVR